MTDVRYIAMCTDRPIADLRKTPWTHKQERERRAITHVLEVDLADLLDVDATDEQRAMFHERMELKHAEQRERYWSSVQAEGAARSISVVWAGELVERDIEKHQWPLVPRGGQHVGSSTGVLLVHKPTGVAIAESSHRSQMRNVDEALKKLRRILNRQVGPAVGEPMPCSACGGAESTCNCDCGGNYCGCECHKPREAG